MERIDTYGRVRRPGSDNAPDPFRSIRRHEPHSPCPVWAERIKECTDRSFRAALGSPYDLAGEVIAHDRQVPLALLVLAISTDSGTGLDSTHPMTTGDRVAAGPTGLQPR